MVWAIAVSDYIRINPSTTTLHFICANEILAPAWTVDTNWHMVTIAWDTSTAWTGYLDGALYATGSGIKNPTGNVNLRAGIVANGSGIYTSGQTYYNGAMDIVSYSTQRAVLADIQAEYNGGSGRQYPFTITNNSGFFNFM